ncbi:MAG: hypothetical protein HYX66_03760 [Ignavibacteria bacterium]|nr:hypothetical protein [Ignavibacteria bacterium]
MRPHNLVWSLIATILLAMSGCYNNSIAPEPCAGYRYEPLSIIAHERIVSVETEIQDTIFRQKIMRFRSTKKSTRYEWTTSFDTTRLWTDSVLTLTFMNYDGPVKIRLITFTEQDSSCGGRNGYDTIYRTFYVVRQDSIDSRIFGKYFGYTTERPSEPLLVEIAHIGSGPNPYQVKITLPIGCNYPSNPKRYGTVYFDYGWRTIVYNYSPPYDFWEDNCRNMSATGILSADGDTMNIQYSFIPPTADDQFPDESYRKYFSFVGVRQ